MLDLARLWLKEQWWFVVVGVRWWGGVNSPWLQHCPGTGGACSSLDDTIKFISDKSLKSVGDSCTLETTGDAGTPRHPMRTDLTDVKVPNRF
jgi:hypothetical protein